MYSCDDIPQGAGTIECVIDRARKEFSDVQLQAKYIKIAIDLMKRDYSDKFLINPFIYSNYEGVLTMFPSGGEMFAYWELYESGSLEVLGVEKYSPNTNKFQILFTSSADWNVQILPLYNKLCHGKLFK